MTAIRKPTAIPLLNEYAYGWVLHQLAPFLDQTMGLSGAME
jgi:hypothetical protein